MTLRPQALPPVPEVTVAAVQAAFPSGVKLRGLPGGYSHFNRHAPSRLGSLAMAYRRGTVVRHCTGSEHSPLPLGSTAPATGYSPPGPRVPLGDLRLPLVACGLLRLIHQRGPQARASLSSTAQPVRGAPATAEGHFRLTEGGTSWPRMGATRAPKVTNGIAIALEANQERARQIRQAALTQPPSP
jgi:hypothetical protein